LSWEFAGRFIAVYPFDLSPNWNYYDTRYKNHPV
jgi:hypothetical protein